MGKPLKISIIICTYNRDRYLFDTLRHIAENDFPSQYYEIVLIDNNSTDHTIAACQRFEKAFPEICFRYFPEKSQGLSFARNRGIKEAGGNYLFFWTMMLLFIKTTSEIWSISLQPIRIWQLSEVKSHHYTKADKFPPG